MITLFSKGTSESKDQLSLLLQWVVNREVVVCKLFNRILPANGVRAHSWSRSATLVTAHAVVEK